jgi:2-amino-4-hydroxy-6-hydroxymethyldihydropteridine diphosphokinase
MKWEPIFLSLGSNLGNRETYLQRALNRLREHPQITLTQLSSVYETEPVGNVDQDSFLNMVAQGETSLSPEQLLHVIQNVEQDLGRRREIYWGPRTIDIDILLYNNKRIDSEELVIPHPRMTERAFVLIPLAEIAPGWIIPGVEKNILELVDLVQGEGVRKWKTRFKNGEDAFELSEN